MQSVLQAVLLLVAVAAVASLARRYDWSAPILLVLLGLAVSAIPGVPAYHLDPEVVLVLFLPPLVYSAAIRTSLTEFRANARPIGLLSVGLVLFTTAAVGLVAVSLIPELTLPTAFALGAIVAPTDAVAATAIARRVGLPPRVVVILEGESLVNDATALVVYRIAVAAAVTGAFSLPLVGLRFVISVVGGAAVGYVVARAVALIRRRTDDPLIENTVSLLTPFVAFLPAEAIGASGILAVVVTGLWLGHRAPVLLSSAARLQNQAIWTMADFLLQGVMFALIGLQLPEILAGLRGQGAATLVGGGVAVTLTVVISRFVWVFPSTYLPRRLSRRLRARDPSPPWQVPAIISWAGMRGVVSLAAAFALPLTTDSGADFPGRDLLLFLTLVVVVTTLVLEGFSLPHVVRWLGLPTEEARGRLQEAAAMQVAGNAALERLEQMLGDEGDTPPGVAERLREKTEQRQFGAWERLGGGGRGAETPSAAYRRLRREMLLTERAEFIRLRDIGEITDDVLRRVQRDLDLEEALLSRE